MISNDGRKQEILNRLKGERQLLQNDINFSNEEILEEIDKLDEVISCLEYELNRGVIV